MHVTKKDKNMNYSKQIHFLQVTNLSKSPIMILSSSSAYPSSSSFNKTGGAGLV